MIVTVSVKMSAVVELSCLSCYVMITWSVDVLAVIQPLLSGRACLDQKQD